MELKFVNALKVIARNNNWEFEKIPDVNTYRYELRLIDEADDTDIKYYIIPQFALGGPYGVRHYTVADFQIICMRNQKKCPCGPFSSMVIAIMPKRLTYDSMVT